MRTDGNVCCRTLVCSDKKRHVPVEGKHVRIVNGADGGDVLPANQSGGVDARRSGKNCILAAESVDLTLMQNESSLKDAYSKKPILK